MTPSEWTELHFGRCAPWLQAALDAEPVPTHTLEHVREALDTERAQLWPTATSAVVAEIATFPTGAKIMHGWLAAGELAAILYTYKHLEAYARESGCSGFEIKARRGWQPIVKPLGLKPVGTHFFKRF